MNKQTIKASVLLVPFAAMAQAQPSTDEASSGASSLMEEIVVTARKREQSLQDVSVSVTALTDALLDDPLITSSEELTNFVPSLTIRSSSRPTNGSFNIRGIGTQSSGLGIEPSVSTMLDGVVLGRSGMAFLQLIDIERVEVLRGSQGTLFGKNSTAGVVHIITKKPSEAFEGAASLTLVEDDEYRAGFTASGPISDSVGFRVTGSYIQDDGFVENVLTGVSLNEKEDWSLRGKLQWDVNEDLSVEWISDVSELSGNCCVSTFLHIDPFPAEPPNNQGAVDRLLGLIDPVVPSSSNTEVNHDFPTTLDVGAEGHSLTADWNIGGHVLTSISAYRQWNENNHADVDLLPSSPLDLWEIGDTDQSQFTQELRIASPADQTISYVLGLYYFDQSIDRFNELNLFNGSAISTFTVDTLNYAAFGEANWNITDSWRLVLGGRYTEDEIEFDYGRESTSSLLGDTPRFEKSVKENDFSSKLALEWDVNDDTLLYASYVDGYKGPAFNVVSGSRPDNTNPVDPERSESFELGVKSSWLDGRLVVNLSLFHAEYADFQAQATETTFLLDENGNQQDENNDGEPDTLFSFILTNVGQVTSQGVEIDLIAQLTENLSLFGGFAYIDAQIDSYEGGPCSFGQEFRNIGFRGTTGCGEDPAQQDLSGGDMPFSPDMRFNLAANYVIPMEESPVELVLRANYRWQDDMLFSIDQDEGKILDAYGVLDASVQLRDKDNRYEATVFVKNLLEDEYLNNISISNEAIAPNAYSQFLPRDYERRIGVELRYNW